MVTMSMPINGLSACFIVSKIISLLNEIAEAISMPGSEELCTYLRNVAGAAEDGESLGRAAKDGLGIVAFGQAKES